MDPTKFNIRCKEINKKARLNDNGQTKVSIDSFQRYWWSKNLGIQLDLRRTWQIPTKSGSFRYYIHLIIIFMQKIKKYQLVLSKDIADQRQDKTTDYTQPKVVASGVIFPWWLIPWRKLKISIHSFKRN